MNYQDKNAKKPNEILEQTINALRSEQPESGAADAAGERVWQRLSQENPAAEIATIRGCDDVRALLPQYQSGKLAGARRMLVEDHLQECAACRKQTERGGSMLRPWTQELPKASYLNLRWAAAAIVLLAVGVSAYFAGSKLLNPSGVRANVESVSGRLYRVSENGEQLLQPGAALGEGEKVRTGGGSKAKLRLRDGSLVEMNERAEFSVSLGFRDTTINLDRGNIIIQAAKRNHGHLYVDAKDCRIAVTGTVFSVNSGIKGSRVSVIEGEVRVAHAGTKWILHSGSQMTTDASVSAVPVQQEIAWSQDLDKHLALLAEFNHFLNKLDQVQLPGLRYQSKLLPMLPQNTVLYAGVPNLGDAVHQANLLFQQELQESPVLREWWQGVQSKKGAPNFEKALEEVHELGSYLGDEIVFSVANNGQEQAEPLILAEVKTPGLKEFIEREIAQHQGADGSHLQVLDEQGLMQAQKFKGDIYILLLPNLVAASGDVATLRSFAATIQSGGGFAATPFGQRMSAAYQNGAGLLFGADIGRLTHGHGGNHQDAAFQQSGFADLKFLVAERKEVSGQTLNHAELSFTGPRHGVASWLAAPGPLGGLDYVSKDASAVAAFVAKSPSQMFDDMLGIISAENSDAQNDINKVESELNISLKHDLADALGGEVTFAFDGPILPTPSWRVIVEVNDPTRLQATLQRLADDFNAHQASHYAPQQQKQTLKIEQESTGGLTYYSLYVSGGTTPVEITYTFTEGYMIMAPNKAMVMSSIRVHQSGNSLASSSDFRRLLPQDDHANVSALLYQNLAPVVGPVLGQLSASQQQSLRQLAAETKPSVVCAYGDESAIQVASNSRFFGLDLNTLALSTLMGLAEHKQVHMSLHP
jgi:hypothetical protein